MTSVAPLVVLKWVNKDGAKFIRLLAAKTYGLYQEGHSDGHSNCRFGSAKRELKINHK